VLGIVAFKEDYALPPSPQFKGKTNRLKVFLLLYSHYYHMLMMSCPDYGHYNPHNVPVNRRHGNGYE